MKKKRPLLSRIIITTSNNLVFDNRVHKISLSLENMGFEVWQTGRDYPRQTLPAGRPGKPFLFSLPFNSGPLFYITLNVRLLWFLLAHSCSIIWSVDMDTLVACRLAGIVKRVPVVFDSHEFFSEVPELQNRRLKKWVWSRLEKWCIPGAAVHFTVSPGLVMLYKNRYNCDFQLLRNLPLRKREVPLPFKVANTHHIVYQGSLNVGRGLSQTIRAMLYLPDYTFIIIGRGDCMDELLKLTSSLKLEERVIFKGAVPFEELEKYNANAMAGMCLLENKGLNYYHSLPNRIFDYMQQGIPVIASDFPDIRAVVKTHETGLLINNLSPETIAHAIKSACEEESLRAKWKETVPRAAAHFLWEHEEEKIENALKKWSGQR